MSSQMPEGYKQTEVGVIPEDWDVKSFQSLFTFQNGVNTDKSSYGKGTLFINVLEPITYSHIYGPEIQGQVTLSASALANYSVRYGDVLFNRTSEIQEEVGLAATYLGTDPVVFGGFVIRGRPINENFCPIYSGYALRASSIRSQIIPLGQGAIRANIGQQSLKLVHAAVPPFLEQCAIASTLSDMDELLASLDRLIAKKRDLKQATMQQLLTGKKRLPEFEKGQGFQQTEVGDIPNDWDVYELGCLCSEIVDGTHYTPNYVPIGVPFYSVENVTADNFQNTKFISEDEHSKLIRRCRPERGDILLTRIGSLGVTKLIDWDVEASIYVSLALLKTNEVVLPGYLYTYSKSRQFVDDLKKRSLVNATPQKINMENIGKIPIPVPKTEKEQTAIAQTLADIDTELTTLQTRRTKTQALKQAMMQQLLTGQTRLITPNVAHA